jgi:hypothetical protein
LDFEVFFCVYSILEMATLTIIPYAPKPPKSNLRKPISKSIISQPSFLDENLRIDSSDVPKSIISQPSFLDENLRIDSSDVPISVPLALHGAAGNSNSWYPKVGGDSEATAQIVHSGGNDIVGARGMCSDPLYPLPLSLSNIIQPPRFQRWKILVTIPTTNPPL